MEEFKKQYGQIDSKNNMPFLIKKLKQYNEDIGEECVKFFIDGNNYVIV